jgi:hypothetical protein
MREAQLHSPEASRRLLLHTVVAGFQAIPVGAEIVGTTRRHFRVEADLIGGPPVTFLAITLQLLDRLIPVGKHEQVPQYRCPGILGQAGRWMHLLAGSDGTVKLIVDGIVIRNAPPVDQLAIRRNGYKEKPTTWRLKPPCRCDTAY